MEITRSDLPPNMIAEYVSAATGALLAVDYFHDPELRWERGRDGAWHIASRHGGGRPTPEWLAANPKPSA